MRDAALVALGGALGSLGRWAVSLWAGKALGAWLPWGTLLVNVAGSFLLGLLLGLASLERVPKEWRLLLGTGGMGALTTFSTFSTDTLTLLREAGLVRASLNLVGNLGLGLGAAAVGFALAKLFAPSHS